ncbi:MAG: T9SS type A sorting domain-containing protein [Saprospiraceae bacterium]
MSIVYPRMLLLAVLVCLGWSLSAQIETHSDLIRIGQNYPKYIFPLSNDNAASPLHIEKILLTNFGKARIMDGGSSIYYMPDPDHAGKAFIKYLACDDQGHCASGDVHIYVASYDQLVAQDTLQEFSIEGAPVYLFTPLDNFSLTGAPSHGTATFITPFAVEYTPDDGFVGKDTVVLQFSDLMTKLFVISVYEKPKEKLIARNGVVHFIKNTRDPVRFNLINNFYNNDPTLTIGDPGDKNLKTYILGYEPQSFLLLDDNGLAEYTYPANFEGVQSFNYQICRDGYCEDATVFLQVSDYQPRNDEPYHFTLAKNNSLVVNYRIPIDADKYAFQVNQFPQNGQIDIFKEIDETTLNCGDIAGTNIIYYEPKFNFTGEDHFTLDYCVTDNQCQSIDVIINVVDEEAVCDLSQDQVWPGDADGNGRVDMGDVLQLGWTLGETGPAREHQGSQWINAVAPDWESSFNGVNLKHADTDGDGYITQADLDAVDVNYRQAHSFVPDVVFVSKEMTDIPVFIEPEQSQLDSGDLAVINIRLGTEDYPALDIHGFAFTLDYEGQLVDSNSVQVNLDTDSWLVRNAPHIELAKDPYHGRIDAAISRANKEVISGHGLVSTVGFIIKEDIEGFKSDEEIPLQLHMKNIRISDKNGATYSLPDAYQTIYVRLRNQETQSRLVAFPNPTPDNLTVHVNGGSSLKSLTVFGLTGQRLLNKQDISGRQAQLDLSALPAGLYILQAQTNAGILTKKIQVQR